MSDHSMSLIVPPIGFVFNDGGRQQAGYKGTTDDCAVRSIAIATHLSYQEAYDLVNEFGARERKGSRRNGKTSARTGVHIPTFRRIMEHLGWAWTPTMKVGEGCRVHMRADELPSGTMILNVSKHYCAVIDGVVHDTYCDDRNGKRCVYGYWQKRQEIASAATQQRLDKLADAASDFIAVNT